jgi:hypothetical protein
MLSGVFHFCQVGDNRLRIWISLRQIWNLSRPAWISLRRIWKSIVAIGVKRRKAYPIKWNIERLGHERFPVDNRHTRWPILLARFSGADTSTDSQAEEARSMRIEPVFLFDLDGTLVDSVYQHVLAWKEALDSEGVELSVWRIHRKIGMSGGLFNSNGKPAST